LTEAEVVSWHVAVGDTVAVNDVVVEIETAKSVVELPSPHAGVVEQILVEAGDTVPVGTPLIVIATGSATGVPATAGDGHSEGVGPDAPAHAGEMHGLGVDGDEKPAVLVGPGPKAAAERRRRIGTAHAAGVAAGPPVASRVHTTPPVRRMARELGVDLTDVAAATGGAVTRADVEAAAGRSRATTTDAPPPLDLRDSPADSRDAAVTRIAVKGVRKATAAAMVRSAFTAPHVTEWLTVDVTASMDLVRRLKADRAWQGVRVNPLVVVARAFLIAVRAHPEINASWDDERDEIVVKHDVNLGIAAATPRGLLVPNIKNADRQDLRSLAGSLESLVATARAGRTQPTDMAGGTVTITNIGALGVDAGTPILNPGESAILALGAVRPQPWVVDGRIEVREVTQLAMSFDHRLVDGELGSHVLALTGRILSDPGNALLFA
jgi:pyruvate dehydrogenase E2 component (dihydrolipoamide acetyltransferase)